MASTVVVPTTEFFKYFNGTAASYQSRHDLITTNLTASSYQVEYANSSGSLTGNNVTDCKHYLSQSFPNSSVPTSTLNEIEVATGDYRLILDAPNRGHMITFRNFDHTKQLDFISETNPLKVTLNRTAATGGNGDVYINATGPWNLKNKKL